MGRVWGPFLGARAQKHNRGGLAGDSGPGRHRHRPFTRRLLDLPWEDVLLPHILSRVPLRQLLRLQRVSRAFRALVQLHLAGLRRFDAAQVSRGPEPRLVGVPPPPRLQPSPQPSCLPLPVLPGLQECPGSEPPCGKYSQRAVPGINSVGTWDLSWESRWQAPRAGCPRGRTLQVRRGGTRPAPGTS